MFANLLASVSVLSQVVLPGLTDRVYSYTAPTAVPGFAYLGGWATAADVGPDKLYIARAETAEVYPINIISALPPSHRNDPTVLRAPRGNLVMWYTALFNTDATAEAETLQNHIAVATSADGLTWQERGLEVWNGWSPCAVEAFGQAILYYHTNGAGTQVFRQPFNLTTLAAEAPPQLLAGVDAVNVSVSRIGNKWWLVGNGIGKYNFYDIVAYTSADGLHFAPYSPDGPVLVSAGSAQLLTPELLPLPNGEASLTFTQEVSPTETATMQWILDLN